VSCAQFTTAEPLPSQDYYGGFIGIMVNPYSTLLGPSDISWTIENGNFQDESNHCIFDSPIYLLSKGSPNQFLLFRNTHHYTKVCGHLLNKHLIPKSWALTWSWSTLCCYKSLHFSGKAFH
jgi:hypothetical protein